MEQWILDKQFIRRKLEVSNPEGGISGAQLVHELKQKFKGIEARTAGFQTVQIDTSPEYIVDIVKMLDAAYSDLFPETILGVDLEDSGFEVIYYFWSHSNQVLCQIRVPLPVDTPTIPSISDIFPGMEWHERETHEMFGVYFEGHPDLRLLLLPEELEGKYPLRKSFKTDRSRLEETEVKSTTSDGGANR
ncbi:MAG: hypothetical protein GF411_01335 [Candidatus Lokiarchaeota archaeon]|nr:hypothetical protein [Candidatus Lokiarchaeota archaeon]